MPIPGTRLWASGETLTAANLIRYINNVLNALTGRSGPVQLEDSLEVIPGSNGSRYVKLPGGTTSQRPGLPAESMIRYNTSTKVVEFYNGTKWVNWGGGGEPVVPVPVASSSAIRFVVDGIKYSSGWNRRTWNAYVDVSRIISYDSGGNEVVALDLSPSVRVDVSVSIVGLVDAPSGFGQYSKADLEFKLHEEDMPSQISTANLLAGSGTHGSISVPRSRIAERRSDEDVGFRFWRDYNLSDRTPEQISWSGSSPNRRLLLRFDQLFHVDSGGIGARNMFSILDELVAISKATGNPRTIQCSWIQLQYTGSITP